MQATCKYFWQSYLFILLSIILYLLFCVFFCWISPDLINISFHPYRKKEVFQWWKGMPTVNVHVVHYSEIRYTNPFSTNLKLVLISASMFQLNILAITWNMHCCRPRHLLMPSQLQGCVLSLLWIWAEFSPSMREIGRNSDSLTGVCMKQESRGWGPTDLLLCQELQLSLCASALWKAYPDGPIFLCYAKKSSS